MSVIRRFLCLEEQWCVIHLPEQPSGFAVLLLGDVNHYVEKNTCFWVQHPSRSQFIQYLLTKGYTVFTSNFFGRHWGSERATRLAIRLYHLVMKREILNKNIHLFAEGMGALVAIKLANMIPEKIRSVMLVNPCLDLRAYYEQEEQNKFFYKRFVYEIATAHSISKKEVGEYIRHKEEQGCECPLLPISILHEMHEKRYPLRLHSRPFQQACEKEGKPVSLRLLLPGKSFSYFAELACLFFRAYEKKL
ncbi:alpha/beta hydrolase family protein [Halalkalibacterium ligniniphilum]|uniref:alpha/beta hydrolase family protein n=1 Tax=Halalkalibacterium ligniniphilum TaxID=1134413 RepID=UPI000345EFD6|nr:alpha/beta hydrolase [Halalkalibacterium ligniniphilum]